MQVEICGDKRFLRDIFGQMEIAQQCIGVHHRHILQTADDLVVGLQIVGLRPAHEAVQFPHSYSLVEDLLLKRTNLGQKTVLNQQKRTYKGDYHYNASTI